MYSYVAWKQNNTSTFNLSLKTFSFFLLSGEKVLVVQEKQQVESEQRQKELSWGPGPTFSPSPSPSSSSSSSFSSQCSVLSVLGSRFSVGVRRFVGWFVGWLLVNVDAGGWWWQGVARKQQQVAHKVDIRISQVHTNSPRATTDCGLILCNVTPCLHLIFQLYNTTLNRTAFRLYHRFSVFTPRYSIVLQC